MEDTGILENQHFSDIQKVISEWQVKIGEQVVRIRITLDNNGYYQFYTSHHYQSPELAGRVTSTNGNLGTETEALLAAERQIAGMYNPDDKKSTWIVNTSF
ncbi:hypothetical protein QN089_05680 [Kurthia sp. YJT4]|uniref:hypothetical protein n=1 Tax=Kurthia sp. YJT4 TaxID=3049086 RepID=UPI00254B777C|nr:hypothetical protein [Kurthia sp. YJT4]WIL39759.1 hypothetical protein QN089_05680 [Kurthia sp. YJT4]